MDNILEQSPTERELATHAWAKTLTDEELHSRHAVELAAWHAIADEKFELGNAGLRQDRVEANRARLNELDEKLYDVCKCYEALHREVAARDAASAPRAPKPASFWSTKKWKDKPKRQDW